MMMEMERNKTWISRGLLALIALQQDIHNVSPFMVRPFTGKYYTMLTTDNIIVNCQEALSAHPITHKS